MQNTKSWSHLEGEEEIDGLLVRCGMGEVVFFGDPIAGAEARFCTTWSFLLRAESRPRILATTVPLYQQRACRDLQDDWNLRFLTVFLVSTSNPLMGKLSSFASPIGLSPPLPLSFRDRVS